MSGASRGPLGLGVPSHRPHERRIMVFDCEVLTKPQYCFIAIVYFFPYNDNVRGRDEYPFGGEHSPISLSLRRLVVPSKPPVFHRVRGWWSP